MDEKERKFHRDLLEDTRNIYKDWVDGLQTKVSQLKKDKLRLAKKLCQLEANWNELKEWLKVCLEENNKTRLYDNNSYQAGETNTLENVIDKMQELERSKD